MNQKFRGKYEHPVSGKYEHPKNKRMYTFEGTFEHDGRQLNWHVRVYLEGDYKGELDRDWPVPASTLDVLTDQVKEAVQKDIHDFVGVDPTT